MMGHVPFAERGGRVRGALDLATGCYPRFLFGGALGDLLPAFHFHDVTRHWLEPRLRFLAENGYRTVSCDQIARLVIDGVSPGPHHVALTFDDAWESVHSVALPLLRQYGLTAILFAIPGRIAETAGESPFVTWAELREIHVSGLFDVQSHTRSHAMIFSDAEAIDFVTPAFRDEPFLNRPVTSTDGPIEAIGADALGTPLFTRRSRMSDARRYFPDARASERCREHVARNGGHAFFSRDGWRRDLQAIVAADGAERFETDADRSTAIRDELAAGRALLNERLKTDTVRHVAMPWGISGTIAREALVATGHELAFAERPFLRRAIRAGDDRFQLMRLNGRFLTCLPGRGRTWFMAAGR